MRLAAARAPPPGCAWSPSPAKAGEDFSEVHASAKRRVMKAFIAILALALLILPMLGAIRRLRRLPPPSSHDEDQENA